MDKLADQGRFMDLTEYSVPPDQPPEEDERQTQQFQSPLDWDDDPDALAHLDSVPTRPSAQCLINGPLLQSTTMTSCHTHAHRHTAR